ncbi:PREDICTED: F-box/WD repeat-containing protein 8-like isoform X1 [Amphimedon queenslandica]|nr:PREDICTED: F-box/WD repeat-containing protein 8-like isoform X1 [Amphimedon queenslandica]|eukprot:XP_019854353.1 PREDICTED: F-box/WD repeat-containing protein 8-like isoform X1 [Amphimedon queenslandica]
MNTVPFFEVQLPRELALLIFNYLSVVDLCHCAQVSRSWAALAEDNLLWIAVCRRMGYSTELVKDQVIHWKTVVKELILHRKQVQQNWMERVCTVTVHKPTSSIGSLCTATYHNREVLACYSTGVCHLWSLSTKESVLAPPTRATPTCSALCNSMGCHCDANGNCTLFSLEDSKVNYTCKVNERIHSLDMATNGGHYAVAFASGGNDSFSSLTLLINKDSSLSDWYKSAVQLPSSAQLNNFHINKVSLVLSDKENSPFLLLYSTHSHLVLQSPLESFITATHFLGEDSPCFVNCFTYSHQSSTVACGSIHYGYHEVRLFDIISGVNKESYRGHSGRICSLSFDRGQNNRLISGGEDKKLNLYDGSSNYPVTSLFGMSSPVVCLQLEDWKVVSGSRDGTVAVWDLRIGQELWRGHDRHSVSLCEVDNEYLIVAHIPSVQPLNTNGSPQHSRQCGAVRMYDFSADLSDYAKKLPSICSSSYDEPSASFYNLNLLYPYDIIQ